MIFRALANSPLHVYCLQLGLIPSVFCSYDRCGYPFSYQHNQSQRRPDYASLLIHKVTVDSLAVYFFFCGMPCCFDLCISFCTIVHCRMLLIVPRHPSTPMMERLLVSIQPPHPRHQARVLGFSLLAIPHLNDMTTYFPPHCTCIPARARTRTHTCSVPAHECGFTVV